MPRLLGGVRVCAHQSSILRSYVCNFGSLPLHICAWSSLPPNDFSPSSAGERTKGAARAHGSDCTESSRRVCHQSFHSVADHQCGAAGATAEATVGHAASPSTGSSSSPGIASSSGGLSDSPASEFLGNDPGIRGMVAATAALQTASLGCWAHSKGQRSLHVPAAPLPILIQRES